MRLNQTCPWGSLSLTAQTTLHIPPQVGTSLCSREKVCPKGVKDTRWYFVCNYVPPKEHQTGRNMMLLHQIGSKMDQKRLQIDQIGPEKED